MNGDRTSAGRRPLTDHGALLGCTQARRQGRAAAERLVRVPIGLLDTRRVRSSTPTWHFERLRQPERSATRAKSRAVPWIRSPTASWAVSGSTGRSPARLPGDGRFRRVRTSTDPRTATRRHPPRYQDIEAGSVSLLASEDGGSLVRIIAGELAGLAGPGITWTPIYAHATVSPGAELSLPWRPDFNALVYVLAGRGTVGAEKVPVGTGASQFSAQATRSPWQPTSGRTPRARRWRCCSSAGHRCGRRSCTTARS